MSGALLFSDAVKIRSNSLLLKWTLSGKPRLLPRLCIVNEVPQHLLKAVLVEKSHVNCSESNVGNPKMVFVDTSFPSAMDNRIGLPSVVVYDVL